MRIGKSAPAILRLVGVLLILFGIRIAVPVFAPNPPARLNLFGITGASLSAGQVLAEAGICILIAMSCIIIGSLLNDDPDI